MKTFSIEHICLLVATIIFLALSSFIVYKIKNTKVQYALFIVAAVLGSGGIFFRYAMDMSFDGGIDLYVLFIQILQVCNFNFVLLPLMLIPRLEIARQYSIYFAMFAACTTLFSIPKSYATYEWHDPVLLNFWFNHVFAVALPLWMFAAGKLKPQRSYILPVSGCVFGYFTIVYGISSLLMKFDLPTHGCSFSYVHDPKGMPLLTQVFGLIKTPYVYLLPLIPLMVGFFYLFSLPFNRYVAFDGNGGGGEVKRRYAAIGTQLKLPHGGFTNEGQVLIGWRGDPYGAPQFEPGEVITMGKVNFTLYAVWDQLKAEGTPDAELDITDATDEETMVFEPDDGEFFEETSTEEENEITEPATTAEQ